MRSPSVLCAALAFALQTGSPGRDSPPEAARARARAHIVVGLPDPSLAPGLVERDAQGELDGFAPRLIEAAAAELRLAVTFRLLPEGDGIDALLAREVDVVCPLSITPRRLALVAFSAPLFIAEGAVFLRQDASEPRSIEELRTLRVSVAKLDVGQGFCAQKAIPCTPMPTLRAALESVIAGQADCVVTTLPAGRFDVRRFHLTGLVDHPLDEELARVAFAAAVRPESEGLRVDLDRALAALRDSGEWDRLHDFWVAPYQPRTSADTFTSLLTSVFSVAAVGLVLVLVLRVRLTRSARAPGENEQHFRALAEGLPALIYSYFVGDDGRRERRFASSNLARWIELFPALEPGADEREILAEIHPDDRERYERATAVARARRSRFDLEFRLRAADGSYHWLHSLAAPMVLEGGVSWQSLLLDVTPLREISQGRQRLELEAVGARKLEGIGLLSSGITREFNTLLTSIQDNLELARGEDRSGVVRASLAQAEDAARRAGALVQRLVAYAGEPHLEPVAIDLGALVRASVAELGPARDGRIALELEGAPLRVLGDEALLRQATSNLLWNALDALPAGRPGRVTVRLGAEQARATPGGTLAAGEHARLEIEDDGVGMDEATQQRVFDPFFGTRPPGRGPGLALVRSTVQRHGGTLELRSVPGGGTLVCVCLPLAVGEAVREHELTPFRRESREVLVVDDDEQVLAVTCALLESRGWPVLRASAAGEALRLARTRRPVIVLLDLTMPDTNGRELARLLRAEQSDLPIVLTSGYVEAEPFDPAETFDGFLQKPFTAELLERVLEQALTAHGLARAPAG